MLAAGGTGGHLFPAFALAQELGRRAIPVDLVTDMRGDRYGPISRPAPSIACLPPPSPGARRSVPPSTGWMLTRGVAACVQAAGRGEARRRGRLRRLSGISAPRRRHGCAASPPRCTSRTPCSAAPTACWPPASTAIATSFEHTKHLEGPALARARLTGNPVRDQVVDWAHAELSAARPRGAVLAAGVRRQPGRALLLRRAAAGAGAAAGRDAGQPVRRAAVPRGGPGACGSGLRAAGVRAHLATFFANLPEEMAKAHLVIGRAGASTVAELTVMGRPAILVPLPHAIDNDQLQNARGLPNQAALGALSRRS